MLPVLAVLPLLVPHDAAAPHGAWGLELLKLFLIITVVIIGGGRVVLRPALRIVARIQVAEVFSAAALLAVIATALLAKFAGLSMSLGAFLAGVLLADSEFRHELEADLEPFKGLLLGLFFIAVGMSANLGLLRVEPLTVLGRHRRLPRDQGAGHQPARAPERPARRVGAAPGFLAPGRRRVRVRAVHAGRAAAPAGCTDRGPAGAGGHAVDDARAAAAARLRGRREELAHAGGAGLRQHRRARHPGDHRRLRPLRADRRAHPAGEGDLLHRARQQPDARRLRAPLRQPGLLRGCLAAGPAARRRRADRAVPGAGHRRCRGLDAHRGRGARAVPAPEDLCARPQPPARVRAHGRRGEGGHPRDLCVEPGDGGRGARGPGRAAPRTSTRRCAGSASTTRRRCSPSTPSRRTMPSSSPPRARPPSSWRSCSRPTAPAKVE